MDINVAIRTSAIIYSDEIGSAKTHTIERKLIEAIFVINDNKELLIAEVIQNLEKNFSLNYEENEIIQIVNDSNEHFEFNQITKLLSLSKKRYEYLLSKEYNPQTIVTKFLSKYPEYGHVKLLELIERYLYELLNTNVDAYLYIINPRKYEEKQGVVDPKNFSDDEISILNKLILWDDEDKNKLFFQLISFSIEYALVSNSAEKTIFYESLHNKDFYLDSNIIFRAIGINGDFRKQRTRYFLRKCLESGQKFSITKYTLQEIHTSIDAHIEELKKYSYGKVNPELFDICESNEGFYQYYHKWRKDSSSKKLEVFKAYLLNEIETLFNTYKITKDYRSTIDQKKKEVERRLKVYKEELTEVKKYQNINTIKTDAINIMVVEKKRKGNDFNIQDTKYYLLTTDQRLKQWDTVHSENQPITILPSHWMGLLLKFISRTNDDYTSFTSFLKIQNNSPLLTPEELETVVTAISEMTEEFQTQSQIMIKLVESKFEGVLKPEISKKSLHDNVISYSKALIEDIYTHEINLQENEVDELNQQLETERKQFKKSLLLERKNNKENQRRSAIEKKNELEKINESIKKVAKRKRIIRTIVLVLLAISFIIGLFILISTFDWNDIEPYTWWSSITYTIIVYILFFIICHTFNPKKIFDEEEIKKHLFNKKCFDENQLKDCISDISDLTKSIQDIEAEITELNKESK